MILRNIQNQVVDGFEIGADGIVYGVINTNNNSLSLNSESCQAIGMTFDTVCRWGNPSGLSPQISVPLSAGQRIVLDDDDCEYHLEIDHLIFVDRSVVPTEFVQKIDNFAHYLVLTNSTETRTELLTTRTFSSNVLTNNPTGIYVDSSIHTSFGNTVSTIKNIPYKVSNFRSNWIKTTLPLNSDFNNFYINININNTFKGISLKIDNIKVIKVCSGYRTIIKEVSVNPSFEYDRVVDNKKSWSETDNFRYKRHTKDRYSNYHTTDDRLVLNSKELEVDLNFKKAMNELLYNYTKKVRPIDDFTQQFDNEEIYRSFEDFVRFFETNINSPRNYRVTDTHPLLNYLNYRFLSDTSFGMEDVSAMVNKLDKYWLDIIAQFIPSTSIWESNIVIANNILSNQKYLYKKYTLEPSGAGSISTNINVDVIVDINNNTPQVNNVPMTIKNYSNGSEFYGTITIL